MLRLRERVEARRAKSFKARASSLRRALGSRWSLVVFVSFYLHNRHPHLLQNLNPFRAAQRARAPHGPDKAHPASNPQFQWTVLWIALVVLGVVGASGLPVADAQAARSSRACTS